MDVTTYHYLWSGFVSTAVARGGRSNKGGGKGVEFQTCWHKPATLNYSSTSCWQAATLFLPTAGLLIGFLPSENNPLLTAPTSGINTSDNFSDCQIFLLRNFKGF